MDRESVLDFMGELKYKPMTVNELFDCLEGEDSEDFKEFVKLLNVLEDEGKIIRTRADTYGLPERMNLVVGRVQGHAKGFCFVISEDKSFPDVYISAENTNTAMHKDRVLVRLSTRRDGARQEGQIIRILERANQRLVGTFFASRSYGFVVPDDKRLANKDIFIPAEETLDAQDGYKVVVEITQFPKERLSAEGKIIEVLGHINEPGVDILSIIRKHGIPEAFPPEVLAEAERIPEAISEEDLKDRRDLRDKKMVTIDGEDAKDLDDAVSIEKLSNGNYRLGVHIADVSYYVKEGSALDEEAMARGNSTYLVDRVIPMLPERLSNGICSLNPRIDRLTMSCEMEFDGNLKVINYEIFPSVIKTVERMTYGNVRKIVEDEDPELMERYKDLVEDFMMLKDLAAKLRNRRMERGAIDFDFVETKIVVDLNGKPVDLVKRERSTAEKIIEECMLVANETVAEHFHWLNIPFIYRVHEEPNLEKLFAFNEFISNFGYFVRGFSNKVHPKSLQQIIEQIEGAPEERIINTVLLRSMKQARYDTEGVGHFGLATEYYTHFTSPIRRYSDLIVHRMIRKSINKKGLAAEKMGKLAKKLQEIAELASERERISVDAERETDELKKVEFMEEHVGEEFEGIITSVTNFGMFVELDNSVEGLVHISYMTDDYYNYHEKSYSLVGERTGRTYRIGDPVKVKLMRANKEERQLDFELIEGPPAKRGAKKKPVAIEVRQPGGDYKKRRRRKSDGSQKGSDKQGSGKRGKKSGAGKKDRKGKDKGTRKRK
ncbi:ribonuclease R [Desulfuribacillus alkaliarsenatis]|uniref:Ribonuclease R n=1 Tax=Desulfuribacillus alkaliarsenatis TaxID=766136 RepID=A0A1E5G448_9FIRM|nr:ribonuclease R [Desulfuribacillus alkaliarsenatis]OEF97857.1 ribonuclease R [Desulfuribacillus alkaliarsenatis]